MFKLFNHLKTHGCSILNTKLFISGNIWNELNIRSILYSLNSILYKRILMGKFPVNEYDYNNCELIIISEYLL